MKDDRRRFERRYTLFIWRVLEELKVIIVNVEGVGEGRSDTV